MTFEPDAYRVLQVQRGAEEAVIHAAYRTLARRYHPDGSDPDQARMIEINLAYSEIRTVERREAYEATRSLSRPAPAGPLARRMAAQDDTPVIDFGTYRGWRIGDIARHDLNYLRWLSRQPAGFRFRSAIARFLPGESELGRAPVWVR